MGIQEKINNFTPISTKKNIILEVLFTGNTKKQTSGNRKINNQNVKKMISVCIATYNGEKYINRQIESILRQIGPGDEVIVSDDGSTDNTVGTVLGIGDRRIRVMNGPGRQSPTLNFENALKAAKGEYIFLADQDDVWKDNKVEVCMKWLERYDCVVSDAEMTDEHLDTIHPSLYKIMDVKPQRLYNTLWKNGYTGCCMAFTRSVLDDALPFPPDIPMHDIWIGNVAAYRHSVKFIGDKLIRFRRHGDTISCNGKGSRYTLWQKMKFRWNIIKNIAKSR